jgi:single-stranded DNA-binding protein
MNRCHKGDLVTVSGKITYREYEDKEGVKRTATTIIANHIQSLEKREKEMIEQIQIVEVGDREEIPF